MKVVRDVGVNIKSISGPPTYLTDASGNGYSVNQALDDERMLIGEVYGQEGKIYVPFHSVEAAVIMEENVEPEEVKDDTCIVSDSDCSETTFAYEEPNHAAIVLGDELTLEMPQGPGPHVGGIAGLNGNHIIDAKSITSSDPSVASVSVESSDRGAYGKLTLNAAGETVVTIVLINGCSHTVKVTVAE